MTAALNLPFNTRYRKIPNGVELSLHLPKYRNLNHESIYTDGTLVDIVITSPEGESYALTEILRNLGTEHTFKKFSVNMVYSDHDTRMLDITGMYAEPYESEVAKTRQKDL
ncbi:MAG: hypothetical protein ACRC6V_01450 [Bacteroidales bacterium]